MERVQIAIPVRGFGETSRPDAWWVQPLSVFTVLSGFIAYATWASYQGVDYRFGPYLSPLYSPELFGDPEHAWFGGKPGWWPLWLRFSPAVLVMWAPIGFRMTCYYYRGAYYKAFWADPPSCTVGEPRNAYRGENSFPLLVQNIHRYFLIFAFALVVFLTHDLWEALWFAGANGNAAFGIGIGTLVLAVNVVLLSGYTFSCHSLRHLVGGRLDSLTGRPTQKLAYDCVSCLNARHMLFAWLSLTWVAFTDVYVRLCATGVWTDFRII